MPIIGNSSYYWGDNPKTHFVVNENGVLQLWFYHAYSYGAYFPSTDGGQTWGSFYDKLPVSFVNQWGAIGTGDGRVVTINGEGPAYHNGALRTFVVNADGTITQLDSWDGWGTYAVGTEGSSDKTFVEKDADGLYWAIVCNVENSPSTAWVAWAVASVNADGTINQLGSGLHKLDNNNTPYWVGIAPMGGGKAIIMADSPIDGGLWWALIDSTGAILQQGVNTAINSVNYASGLKVLTDGTTAVVIGRFNGEEYITAAYLDIASGAWGPRFNVIGASGGTWSFGATLKDGTVYVAASKYQDRSQLFKATFSFGSTTVTTGTWGTLEAALRYYDKWQVEFLPDGNMWVVWQDGSSNLRYQIIQYAAAGPTIITETLTDTIGFAEALRGKLGVGVQDGVGMADLKGGSPTQSALDSVNLADILGVIPRRTEGLIEVINLNSALFAGTSSVISAFLGLSALAREVARNRDYASIELGESAVLGAKITQPDTVTLAGAVGLTAASGILAQLELVTQSAASPASALTADVPITAAEVEAVFMTITDGITLKDVVTALQQVLVTTQQLADALNVGSQVKADLTAELDATIRAVEKLAQVIAVMEHDAVGLVAAVTAAEILNTITTTILDTLGMVDSVTLNAISVALTGVVLRTSEAGDATTITADDVGVVSRESVTAALSFLDAWALPDVVTATPRTALREVMPLLDEVVTHYARAIQLLSDAVGLADLPSGSVAGFKLGDALTVTDAVSLAEWLFVREVLRLYSRITTLLTVRSAITALVKRRSIIEKIVRKGGE